MSKALINSSLRYLRRLDFLQSLQLSLSKGISSGRGFAITASVQLSAKEFDEMRAARTEVKQARKAVEQVKATERELAAFYAVGKQLLTARANKRVIAPLFEELEKLVNAYSEKI